MHFETWRSRVLWTESKQQSRQSHERERVLLLRRFHAVDTYVISSTSSTLKVIFCPVHVSGQWKISLISRSCSATIINNNPCRLFYFIFFLMWRSAVTAIHGKTAPARHTTEAHAQVGSASQRSQAVPHCASLKQVGSLILMLPWRHPVNLAFLSLWMDSGASLFPPLWASVENLLHQKQKPNGFYFTSYLLGHVIG